MVVHVVRTKPLPFAALEYCTQKEASDAIHSAPQKGVVWFLRLIGHYSWSKKHEIKIY